MFYVCDIKGDKFGIKDSIDNVVEYYSESELIDIDNRGVGIYGRKYESDKFFVVLDEESICIYTGDYRGRGKWDCMIPIPYSASEGTISGAIKTKIYPVESMWVRTSKYYSKTFRRLNLDVYVTFQRGIVNDSVVDIKFKDKIVSDFWFSEAKGVVDGCKPYTVWKSNAFMDSVLLLSTANAVHIAPVEGVDIQLKATYSNPDDGAIILRRYYSQEDNELYFYVAIPRTLNNGAVVYDYGKAIYFTALQLIDMFTTMKFSNVVLSDNGFTYSGLDGTIYFNYTLLRKAYDKTEVKERAVQRLKAKMANLHIPAVYNNGEVRTLCSKDGVVNIPQGCVSIFKGVNCEYRGSNYVEKLVIPNTFRYVERGNCLASIFGFCIETHSRHFLEVSKLLNGQQGYIDWENSEPVSALLLFMVLFSAYTDEIVLPLEAFSNAQIRSKYAQQGNFEFLSLSNLYEAIFIEEKFRDILTPSVLDEMWEICLRTYKNFDTLEDFVFDEDADHMFALDILGGLLVAEVNSPVPNRCKDLEGYGSIIYFVGELIFALTSLTCIYSNLYASWLDIIEGKGLSSVDKQFYIDYEEIIKSRYAYLLKLCIAVRQRFIKYTKNDFQRRRLLSIPLEIRNFIASYS